MCFYQLYGYCHWLDSISFSVLLFYAISKNIWIPWEYNSCIFVKGVFDLFMRKHNYIVGVSYNASCHNRQNKPERNFEKWRLNGIILVFFAHKRIMPITLYIQPTQEIKLLIVHLYKFQKYLHFLFLKSRNYDITLNKRKILQNKM